MDTKTRKLLNMHEMLHPKADVERLYILIKDGGRGLIDVNSIQNSNNRAQSLSEAQRRAISKAGA